MASYTKSMCTMNQCAACKNRNIKIVLSKVLKMLIINKYTNPQTGAVSVCCHIMKNEKVIKSYKPMHEDDLELFKGRFKRAMINNVSHRSRLNFVEMLDGF